MKRFSFVLLLSAVVLTCAAQKHPMWTIRVGYGISDWIHSDSDGVPSLQIGGTVEIPLSRTFGFQTGLSYMDKGALWTVENGAPDGTAVRFRMRLHGVYAPLFLTYHIPMGDAENHYGFVSSLITLKLGPYVGYGLGGRLKKSAAGEWQPVNGNPYSRSYNYNNLSLQAPDGTAAYLGKLNRCEAGVAAGVDVVAFGIINVSLEGGIGLTPLTTHWGGRSAKSYFVQGALCVPLSL